jgi:hypothetical protein
MSMVGTAVLDCSTLCIFICCCIYSMVSAENACVYFMSSTKWSYLVFSGLELLTLIANGHWHFAFRVPIGYYLTREHSDVSPRDLLLPTFATTANC